MTRLIVPLAVALLCSIAGHASQEDSATVAVDPLHRSFDQVLDTYVRDGLVYYNALRIERDRFDQYVASLDGPAVAGYKDWPRERQLAFWLNAYNAFVIRAVIDRYPIRGGAPQYPRNSLRQIPGAFEQIRRRAAGRSVTLDEIEKTVLPAFRDPRVYLALGRGAIGGGRLRSEAYTAERLASQLEQVAAEVTTRPELVRVDRIANRVTVSPIFSWHEAEFVAGYGGGPSRFAARSPIERAVLAFIDPHLLPGELEFLEKNEFAVRFHDFDWRLNDLTGGGGRE